MKLLRALLLVVGLVFLGVLVATNEPAAIFDAVAGLSWRLAVVAVFPFVLVTTFDTLGWKYAFLRDRVAFRTLLAVRIAGEAFNLTTPTASLGGEAIKASTLRSAKSRSASASGASTQEMSLLGFRPTNAAMLERKMWPLPPSGPAATVFPFRSRIARTWSVPNSSKQPI